jgi:hypothetical protein
MVYGLLGAHTADIRGEVGQGGEENRWGARQTEPVAEPHHEGSHVSGMPHVAIGTVGDDGLVGLRAQGPRVVHPERPSSGHPESHTRGHHPETGPTDRRRQPAVPTARHEGSPYHRQAEGGPDGRRRAPVRGFGDKGPGGVAPSKTPFDGDERRQQERSGYGAPTTAHVRTVTVARRLLRRTCTSVRAVRLLEPVSAEDSRARVRHVARGPRPRGISRLLIEPPSPPATR